MQQANEQQTRMYNDECKSKHKRIVFVNTSLVPFSRADVNRPLHRTPRVHVDVRGRAPLENLEI